MNKDIYTIITNIAHKRQVEDLLKIYKPVAVAIDRMQSAKVNLADAVKIWLYLGDSLNGVLPFEYQSKFAERRKQNLTHRHFLAFLLDPRYVEIKLTAGEASSALDFASEVHPELLSYFMKFRTKTALSLTSFRQCNGCSPQRLVETCQGPRGDIKNLSKDFGLLAVYWISGKTFQHIRLGSLEGTKQTRD